VIVDERKFHPWPVKYIAEELSRGTVLADLCQCRVQGIKFNTRERLLESLVRQIISRDQRATSVTVQRSIGKMVGIESSVFPARTRPDVAMLRDGRVHICELKSTRVDYSRFDCVFESQPLARYLSGAGHTGADPWEVEQDLLKLSRFAQLSSQVGSCLFLMVDAYSGTGRSWSNVFSSVAEFRRMMRTDAIRDAAEVLVSNTQIFPIRSAALEARIIVCSVFSREST